LLQRISSFGSAAKAAAKSAGPDTHHPAAGTTKGRGPGGSPLVPVKDPGSPLTTLVLLLGEHWSTPAAARLIASLVNTHPGCAPALAAAGVAPALCEVLADVQDNPAGATAALALLHLLQGLAATGPGVTQQLLAAGVTTHLLRLLRFSSSQEVARASVAALALLAGYGDGALLSEVIGTALLQLVAWLRSGSTTTSTSSTSQPASQTTPEGVDPAVAAAAVLSAALDAGAVNAAALAQCSAVAAEAVAAAEGEDAGVPVTITGTGTRAHGGHSHSYSGDTAHTLSRSAPAGGAVGPHSGGLGAAAAGDSSRLGWRWAARSGSSTSLAGSPLVEACVAHCMAVLPLEEDHPEEEQPSSRPTTSSSSSNRGQVQGEGSRLSSSPAQVLVAVVAVRLLRVLGVLEPGAGSLVVELGGIPRLVALLTSLVAGSNPGGVNTASKQARATGTAAAAPEEAVVWPAGSDVSSMLQQLLWHTPPTHPPPPAAASAAVRSLMPLLVHEVLALLDSLSLSHRGGLVACPALIPAMVSLLRLPLPTAPPPPAHPVPPGRGQGGGALHRSSSARGPAATPPSSNSSSSGLCRTASTGSLHSPHLQQQQQQQGGVGATSSSWQRLRGDLRARSAMRGATPTSSSGAATATAIPTPTNSSSMGWGGMPGASGPLGLSPLASASQQAGGGVGGGGGGSPGGLLLGSKVLACQLITVLAINNEVKRQLFLEDAVGPLMALAETLAGGPLTPAAAPAAPPGAAAAGATTTSPGSGASGSTGGRGGSGGAASSSSAGGGGGSAGSTAPAGAAGGGGGGGGSSPRQQQQQRAALYPPSYVDAVAGALSQMGLQYLLPSWQQ
jgi:hypothetical protein